MKLPRFTLRDLFWVVLVVALGLGWWLESGKCHERLAVEADKRKATVDAFLRWLRKRQYRVNVDEEGRIEIHFYTWTETIDPSVEDPIARRQNNPF